MNATSATGGSPSVSSASGQAPATIRRFAEAVLVLAGPERVAHRRRRLDRDHLGDLDGERKRVAAGARRRCPASDRPARSRRSSASSASSPVRRRIGDEQRRDRARRSRGRGPRGRGRPGRGSPDPVCPGGLELGGGGGRHRLTIRRPDRIGGSRPLSRSRSARVSTSGLAPSTGDVPDELRMRREHGPEAAVAGELVGEPPDRAAGEDRVRGGVAGIAGDDERRGPSARRRRRRARRITVGADARLVAEAG